MRRLSLVVAVCLSLLSAQAEDSAPKAPPDAGGAMKALESSSRHGEWVDIPIEGSDTRLHAWLVHPERKEKAPVVIVIHEIFGMTDWVRSVADQLAAEGFVAIAPDLLSGKGPDGGGTDSFKDDQVRGAIQKLKPAEVAQRLNATRAFAIALPNATEKTATIGFCWGGGASFAYATQQPKLNAAVVYYGAAPADKRDLAKIIAPVLGLYGGDDARVTKTVEPTKALMSELKKPYTPHIYDGAGHGFLRQQAGKSENAKAAAEAWGETIKFLKASLEQP